MCDSQAQAERLQAGLTAAEQQHATTLTSLQLQHRHALSDLQQEKQQQLDAQQQLHNLSVQALQVGPSSSAAFATLLFLSCC